MRPNGRLATNKQPLTVSFCVGRARLVRRGGEGRRVSLEHLAQSSQRWLGSHQPGGLIKQLTSLCQPALSQVGEDASGQGGSTPTVRRERLESDQGRVGLSGVELSERGAELGIRLESMTLVRRGIGRSLAFRAAGRKRSDQAQCDVQP